MNDHAKGRESTLRAADSEIHELAKLFLELKLNASLTSDVATALEDIDTDDLDLFNKSVDIEDHLEVKEAMVSECLEALELWKISDDDQEIWVMLLVLFRRRKIIGSIPRLTKHCIICVSPRGLY